MGLQVHGASEWPDEQQTRSPEPVTRPGPRRKGSTRKGLEQHGTIVVKVGGSTLGSLDTTLEDLVAIQREGSQVVVVHGGGKTITEWMERQGVRPKFVRGLRVTDSSSLDIVVAVLTGLINKSIVASIQEAGGRAVGLSGVDGAMLRAEVLEPELGLVGGALEVDTEPMRALIEEGFLPVIAPVAVNRTPEPQQRPFLNVNADTAAGEIAAALEADRLVFMTDVEGVMDSSRRTIPRLTQRQARGLIRSNVLAGGMLPKIGACLKALDEVRSAHIVDGRRPHALRDALSCVPLGTLLGKGS